MKGESMKDGGRVLEFNIEDLKHLRNYLWLAQLKVTDIFKDETDSGMAEMEREELASIEDMAETINNFLKIFG
jgi:hypothetical protein